MKNAKKIIHLPRGQLTLTYQINPNTSYQLEDLLDFAERINPKRAFLFVSKVLGRHIPVAPSIMRQVFTDLANLIPRDLPTPILVIGMAETAVGLSAGVHQTLQQYHPNVLLLNSTRHAQNAPLLTTFCENHSHASQHLIYQSHDQQIQQQIFATKTLIMVDDEASTGQTCQNVVKALQDAGLQQLQQIHLLTLTDWSLNYQQPNDFKNLKFYRHHLLSGSWQWVDHPNPPTIHMPKLDTTKAGHQPLLNTENWGRFPTLDSQKGMTFLLQAFQQQIDMAALVTKKVLVLGSNEFVWLPFLLAEFLEKQQIQVKFSALTRSPIALGGAISHTLSFQDNYGLGMTNFVYNVNPDEWDYIFLCIETPKYSVDHLWKTLKNVYIIHVS